MRKILFLDVDGVLNNTAVLTKAAEERQFDPLSDEMLAILKRVYDETQCEIVVSSTWRLYRDTFKKLRVALHKNGMPHLVDSTPVVGNGDKRHLEIEQYLAKQVTEDAIVVVLDDYSNAKIQTAAANIKHFFVQTHRYSGLNERAFGEIISAFNN